MKKLKALAAVMILLMTTMMVGCGSKTPTKTVEEYFKKIQKGDTDVSYLLNNVTDKETDNESEELTDEVSKELIEVISKLTYTVNSETITEDTAIVNVTVNGADLSIVLGKVLQDSITYAFSQAFSGTEMTDEETDKYYNDLFIKYLAEVTYSERSGDITLTKVDGEWKISEDNELSRLLTAINPGVFE